MAKGNKRRDIPPRPTVDDEAVTQNGIIAFCRQFKEYDAAQLLEIWSVSDEDGYSLARALEDYGFSPTAETVDELSQLASYMYDAQITAEKQWVRENNVQLRIQPGQQVQFPFAKGDVSGVITGTDPARALYLIKRDGDTDPSRRYYVQAERVKVSVFSCSEGNHKQWPCPSCGMGPCLQGIEQ